MNTFSLRPRPALHSVPRDRELPLTPAQVRAWSLDQAIAIRVDILGSLDVDALKAALGDVIARHEILHTTFQVGSGSVPYQRIDPDQTGIRLEESLENALHRHFDLESEPPIRAALISLRPDEFVLLLVIHEIAFDAWSIAPLLEDLSRAYDARQAGRAPAFSKLQVQYADYTRWQQRMLGNSSDPNSTLSRQLAFWTRSLADLPHRIRLSIERAGPVSVPASRAVDAVPVRIDHALHRQLVSTAKKHGANVFMLLHAALVERLAQLGAGPDVAIATIVSGRSHGALHQLVGRFANPLILRTDTSGNPAFSELVSRVRLSGLTARAYQDLPIEYLGNVPLQFFLMVDSSPAPQIPLEGAKVTVAQVSLSAADFDLMFDLRESPSASGIEGRLLYRGDLYQRVSMEDLVQDWLALLERGVNDPDQPVEHLELERRMS